MQRTITIAAILMMLLQGTAWASMGPMPSPAEHGPSHEPHETTHHVMRHASDEPPGMAALLRPCNETRGETPPPETSEHTCPPECASVCAGVAAAMLTAFPRAPEAPQALGSPSSGLLARQPDNPFRPPIASLR